MSVEYFLIWLITMMSRHIHTHTDILYENIIETFFFIFSSFSSKNR